MKTVLIPTAGTGSRLGNITNYTNKSLVPVGNKLALCHIIEAYDDQTEFIILLGYKGHLVKEFCSLAYPLKKIRFVDVNLYEGPGSSLVYSLLQAKEFLQTPFYFHCCDTMLTSPIPNFTENTVVVCKDSDYQSYSSISVNDRSVISMHSKGFQGNDYCYIGVAYYKDARAFWDAAEHLYNEQKENQSLSDIHCIQNMMTKNSQFTYHTVSEFYDTGNLESYTKCQSHFHQDFEVLLKHNESLCFLPGKVIKFQADKQINEKRYKRGVSLQANIPRLIGVSDHFISMEFVSGTLLADSLDYGDIYRLLEWAQTHLWQNTTINPLFLQESHDFYITKTKQRLSQIDLSDERMCVNGLFIGSILDLLQEIHLEFLVTDTFTQFHGDFILDNILKTDNNSFVLLDWRHEFGKQLYLGDMYYDLAKLRHNIIFNHKNINKKLFHVSKDATSAHVDLKCNYILIKQLEDFDFFLEKYNYNKKKIMILTAIVWLNMAPLYENPLREFLFYFGKLNLYLALSGARP